MRKIFLIIVLSVVAYGMFANDKLTIRNIDTGESFEVEVPENLKIYEVNTNWLDSVPYLIDHAKWREPWAYKALGDCYRYGRGGLEKSILNAVSYYQFTNRLLEDIAQEANQENPDDEMANMFRIISILDKNDMESLKREIDTMSHLDFPWLDFLKKVVALNVEKITADDLKLLLNANPTVDERFMAIGFLINQRARFDATDEITLFLINKIPSFYSLRGDYYLELYTDNPEEKENLELAMKYYKLADDQAILEPYQIKNILNEFLNPDIEFFEYFTRDDLERFISLVEI